MQRYAACGEHRLRHTTGAASRVSRRRLSVISRAVYGSRGEFEQGEAVGHFDHTAAAHHIDAVAKLRDDTEIMRYQQQGHGMIAVQPLQSTQHAKLNRRIQRRGWFVRNQQFRRRGQRNCDHGALTHAARQFVRIAARNALRLRQSHLVQQSMHPGPDFAARPAIMDGFSHLHADPPRWVERSSAGPETPSRSRRSAAVGAPRRAPWQ